MRTIKIIDHDKLDRICTLSVHCISFINIRKPYENAGIAYLEIWWGSDYESIVLPVEKAYELYDKIASWLSNEVTNLEVELIRGMSIEDAVDYIAVEK